jgi:hypothetical protein
MRTTPTSVFFIGNCPELAHAHNSFISFFLGNCPELAHAHNSHAVPRVRRRFERNNVPTTGSRYCTVAIEEQSVQVFVCSMQFPSCSLKSFEPGEKVESAFKIETNMIFHAFPRFLNFLNSSQNFVLAM